VTSSKELCLLVFVFALANSSAPLASQDLSALTSSCIGKMRSDQSLICHRSILAARTIRSGVNLSAGYGSELPGSSNAIGRKKEGRLQARNLSFAFSSGFSRIQIPNLYKVESGQALSNAVNVYGLNGTFVLGLFDGLTISPEVRGLFSMDVLGTASAQFFNWASDHPIVKAGTGSVGLRIGLLRESFSFPGITVSVVSQTGLELDLDSPRKDHVDLAVGNKSMRFRTIIGKDFSKLGLLAGIGWNHNGGLLQGTIPGMLARSAWSFSSEETVDRQVLYFTGLSFTDMVFQLSLELGLIGGLDFPSNVYVGYGPDDSTVFSRLAIRVRF
jgi:hypothetical protein